MIIRDEQPDDAPAICTIIAEAFKPVPYSRQTEVAIYNALRTANAMKIALVAEEEGAIVGHAVLSQATIGDTPSNWLGGDWLGGDWLGAGPVAVRPDRQKRGIGSALITATLERARRLGVSGCVLVGNPGFYGRFGFAAHPGLTCDSAPDPFVMGISFGDAAPKGVIRFHPAFAAE